MSCSGPEHATFLWLSEIFGVGAEPSRVKRGRSEGCRLGKTALLRPTTPTEASCLARSCNCRGYFMNTNSIHILLNYTRKCMNTALFIGPAKTGQAGALALAL